MKIDERGCNFRPWPWPEGGKLPESMVITRVWPEGGKLPECMVITRVWPEGGKLPECMVITSVWEPLLEKAGGG